MWYKDLLDSISDGYAKIIGNVISPLRILLIRLGVITTSWLVLYLRKQMNDWKESFKFPRMMHALFANVQTSSIQVLFIFIAVQKS